MKVGRRYAEGGKLSISKDKVEVDPPKGYHWMEEQGRYYLMKGEYKEQYPRHCLKQPHTQSPNQVLQFLPTLLAYDKIAEQQA